VAVRRGREFELLTELLGWRMELEADRLEVSRKREEGLPIDEVG
jgi:hypothetical protein